MNETTAISNIAETFLSDKDLAKVLNMSQSWIRKQRYLRARNKDHVLALDAIYLGASPRYRTEDFNEWLDGLNRLSS